MTQMGVPHQPQLFEQLERPIDGGDIDTGRALLDPRRDLVGRAVLEHLDGFEYQLPLRGEAVATSTQLRGQVDLVDRRGS